ncbi:MAG TPA: hypothetical protein VF741_10235 [Candidatus Aquilonibacter sp.]
MLAAFLLAATVYTLPSDIHWIRGTSPGDSGSFYYAYLRGKPTDKCDTLQLIKLSDGYQAHWHVNNVPGIYTILQGTLVIGFDKQHKKSAERAFPTGSVIQGLATEPHYGHALGEVIFSAYTPCAK